MAFRVVLSASPRIVKNILAGLCTAAVAKRSFEINPASMGNPTMERLPTAKASPAVLFLYPDPRRLR